MDDYILITAAHNEEAFIGLTCESVLSQTHRPARWVVVDDASTDATAAIVSHYARQQPGLIELIRVDRPAGRDFGNKVRAFQAGLVRARALDFQYIGNLDADISLDPGYYATVLSRFEADPGLGIAGGMVASQIEGAFVSQQVASDSVAGAVQLFRRACFDAVGGYLPLRLGGIDAAAEIVARRKGWSVRTFEDLRVLEHRRTGSASATPLAARLREGRRLYSLGYGFTFFAARCARRSLERPRIIGSASALCGYLGAALRREPIVLPHDVVRYLRAEQRRKLWRLLDRADIA